MWNTIASVGLGVSLSTAALAGRDGCEVLGTTTTPGLPGGVAHDGEAVWVAEFFAARIHRIDPATGEVLATIPAPAVYTGGLAWDGTTLWAAPEQTGMLMQLDPATGAVLHAIDAPTHAYRDPNGSGLAWDGAALWHADYGTRKLRRIDPVDGAVLAELPSPGTRPMGLAMLGEYLVVVDGLTDELAVVDPADGSVVSLCPAADPHGNGLAVGPDGVAYMSGWNALGLHRSRLPAAEGEPWWQAACDGTSRAADEVARVVPEGSPSVGARDLRLRVDRVPDDLVLLMGSARQAPRPFHGGTLCVGPGARLVGVGRAEAGQIVFDAFARNGLRRRVEAGESWTFQALVREPAGIGMDRIGLSAAVTVGFVD